MKQPQTEELQKIEDLARQRLDLIKLYPVLSVKAMQCLEKNDAEGFGGKLDERGDLLRQVDAITAKIDLLVSQLDNDCSAVIKSLLNPDEQSGSYPSWSANIAVSFKRMQKLLKSCALFDARLLSHAKAMNMEIQDRLGRMRAQRKLQSIYADKGAVAYGVHIHYSSK